MNKPEKEITSLSEIEDIIHRAKTCRLALCDNGRPYVVPVCYGYEDRAIYFHSATDGLKLDILKRNNDVCFQMDADIEFVESASACSWSLKYKSVIGRGKAGVLKSKKEKIKALQTIMLHYSSQDHAIDEKRLDSVEIVRISIYELKGKKSEY